MIAQKLYFVFLNVLFLRQVVKSSAEYGPIATLNTTAYLGLWYQTHASLNFVAIELGATCVTAEYKLEKDDTISLINQGRPRIRLPLIGTLFYFPKEIAGTTGIAVQSPGPDTQGLFGVTQGYNVPLIGGLLDTLGIYSVPNDINIEYADIESSYVIFAIGPIVNGQYEWAGVSNLEKTLSFIIARNVEYFEANYEADVLDIFEDFGFTRFFDQLPRKTTHEDCVY